MVCRRGVHACWRWEVCSGGVVCGGWRVVVCRRWEVCNSGGVVCGGWWYVGGVYVGGGRCVVVVVWYVEGGGM